MRSFVIGLVLLGSSCAFAASGLPTPDHVVVVIEENHSYSEIIGSASAPYINTLKNSGANFTQSFAVTHPSQPNYLALFSGSTQGVTNDSIPIGIPYSTANLAANLIAAGRTFGGYSESQPSVGYNSATFTTVSGQNQYVRKHNPWSNWQTSTTPTPTNQLPPSVNMPFAGYFPTGPDYSTLPTVSFVVPNEQNDMHDGSIAQADTWLSNNINAYKTWAMTHNSLLIVTWDEDDSSMSNQIPTIFVGPMVKAGTYSGSINHYNVLRTIEDFYNLPHAGAAANAAPITTAFVPEPAAAAVLALTLMSSIRRRR
jgi:acid phosphatase